MSTVVTTSMIMTAAITTVGGSLSDFKYFLIFLFYKVFILKRRCDQF